MPVPPQDEHADTVLQSGAPAMALTGPLGLKISGYEIGREIGRGGQGMVLIARDLVFGRDVAIKTLLPDTANKEGISRFLTESRITGRLTHPGIPAVYALGTLPDGRPYLTMKLIGGRTLHDLLKDRSSPADELPRFIQIFEQVCQAVGSAHSQGIIHRDLKPQNVMVGAFGEVHVMDWGLAKDAKSVGDPDSASQFFLPGQSIASTPQYVATRLGVAMGTPPFMPPEQAHGEWDRVDARADVFSLGGILSIILTGKPPYTGANPRETLTRAKTGDVKDAFARLEASDADKELIELAKRCLAPRVEERPADATAVAEIVSAYRTHVEERLHTAERDRANAVAQALERQKQRPVKGILAGLIALLILAGLGIGWWQVKRSADQRVEQERAAATARTEEVFAELDRKARAAQASARVESELAQVAILQSQGRFAEAMVFVESLKNQSPEAAARITQLAKDLELAQELEAIRSEVRLLVFAPDGSIHASSDGAPLHYRAALLAQGIDPLAADVETLATQLTNSPIRQALLDALEDWAVWERDPATTAKLLAVLRRCDPSPWKDRLRDPVVRSRESELNRLTIGMNPAAVSSVSLMALADLLSAREIDSSRFLHTLATSHPADFVVLDQLARASLRRDPLQALGWFRTARALRPADANVASNLAMAYFLTGDLDAAVEAFEEAVRLDPTSAALRVNLGTALQMQGEFAKAKAAYREATRLDAGQFGYLRDRPPLLQLAPPPRSAKPH